MFYVVNCFLCCANITESVTLMLKYNFNSETRLRMWRVQWIKFVLRDVKGESITVNNSPFKMKSVYITKSILLHMFRKMAIVQLDVDVLKA